jgi:multicomponent Na+:H+ antiporter subunit E
MLAVFLACFGFWWLLSDRYTWVSLALAVASAALVAWANRDLEIVRQTARALPGFLAYLPWLLKEIVVSNVAVTRIVLDPRLPIDPVVVHLPTPLTSDLALMALGNSITLTPGTVTLDIAGSTLVVHALTAEGAAGLVEGAMVRRVARAFAEVQA